MVSKIQKQTVKKPETEKIEFKEILGECHDGQDLKLLMPDGSIKIVPREKVR